MTLKSKYCTWKEGGLVWLTDCGHQHIAKTADMKFCCYCGKKLVEVQYKEAKE